MIDLVKPVDTLSQELEDKEFEMDAQRQRKRE